MRAIIFSFILLSAYLSNAQTWSYVGPCCIESGVDNLSTAGSDDLDFLNDGTPVVSYFRQTGGSTTGKVKQFNGATWEQLGSDLPNEGTISAIDLEIHTTEIYASVLYNATQIRVYQYSNNEWVQQGEMINGNLAYDFLIDNTGGLYLFTTTDQSIRKFNGGVWEVALTISESSSPMWAGDQSIVINANNEMYYVQPYLNLQTLTFESTLHVYNGSNVSPFGGIFYAGLGNPGKPGINNAGELHVQYQSNNTNKISKLEGNSWTQLLDTTNAINGVFGFKYAFTADDQLILTSMTNVYFANGYAPLPTLPTEGMAVLINEMVLAPNGKIYVSFAELPGGSGMNFSVMVLENNVSVDDDTSFSFGIYPNPSSASFSITSAVAGDILRLYDMQGRNIFSETITTNAVHNFKLQLPSGSYCVLIERGNQIHSEIIQIQHP
ncbi:MAG: T9SS type A sorting domain-containing protein [Flavobacteriales bacterium]